MFLNLGTNHITALEPEHFTPFKDSLRTLWIESNQLQTLKEELLNWGRMNVVKLGHNPWMCDCNIHWIYKLEHKHYDKENVT